MQQHPRLAELVKWLLPQSIMMMEKSVSLKISVDGVAEFPFRVLSESLCLTL